MNVHDHETKSRLLAKLVRELLASERFETLADLTDALKARCARLKIRYTPSDISAAFHVIASNTALAEPPAVLERRPEPTAVLVQGELIPRGPAAKIYGDIMARYRQEQPPSASAATPGRPDDFPDLVPV